MSDTQQVSRETLHYRVARAIVSRHDAGESCEALALDYGAPLYVVAYLCRALRTRLWARQHAQKARRRALEGGTRG